MYSEAFFKIFDSVFVGLSYILCVTLFSDVRSVF